jgi:enoyl-CoA hydratase/carnithine racemase/NADPH:quinone reductase-like Zn-dependent oxidoreductase/3-oxoacyl-(acyl-carrier-protein) synthase
VPSSRWALDSVRSQAERHGAFVAGGELFDSAFFGVAPAEALAMDPQQRLLLEMGYASLHGGSERLSSLRAAGVGVSLGIMNSDYSSIQKDNGVYAATGATISIAAGRLSFALGTQGPCVSVDTACSSSLVALHGAASATSGRECGKALVVAVSLMLTPATHAAYARAGMLSADGRCKTFDARANGYARGEGVGALTLEDGAVAQTASLSCRVRSDGKSASLTAPNGTAQASLLTAALRNAGIDTLQRVEAHGTGTALGDPTEMGGLQRALGATEPGVGSMKAGVGHTEPMAGLAGLVATLQGEVQAAHGTSGQLRVLNHVLAMPVSKLKAHLATQRSGMRHVESAGVSSFGYSGTIAHAALQLHLEDNDVCFLHASASLLRNEAFPERVSKLTKASASSGGADAPGGGVGALPKASASLRGVHGTSTHGVQRVGADGSAAAVTGGTNTMDSLWAIPTSDVVRQVGCVSSFGYAGTIANASLVSLVHFEGSEGPAFGSRKEEEEAAGKGALELHAPKYGLRGADAAGGALGALRKASASLGVSLPKAITLAQKRPPPPLTYNRRVFLWHVGAPMSATSDEGNLLPREMVACVYEAHLIHAGAINNLVIRAIPPLLSALTLNQASLEVRAAGLNFRDVLNVLGLDPTGLVRQIGGEAAGVIAEVEASTLHMMVGVDAYGLVPGCFRSFVRCDARYVSLMPRLPFDRAVSLPVVWITAQYCMQCVRVYSKASMLIHAAAGGVGWIGTMLTWHAGAYVQATAGGVAKHAMLRMSNVVHIASSRDASAFAAHRVRSTRLNSLINALSKDFISTSAALLASGGTFTEIGKNAIWSYLRCCAAQLSIVYIAVAVDEGCLSCSGWNCDPWWFGNRLHKLAACVHTGTVTTMPIVCYSFETRALHEAMRLLQRGANLGKVVVRMGGINCAAASPTERIMKMDHHAPYCERAEGAGSFAHVSSSKAGLAIIELNDPSRFNTMGDALGHDVRHAVKLLCSTLVHALVLHGAGTVFCAGGNPFASRGASLLADFAHGLRESIIGYTGMVALDVPIVCATHGAMVGGAAAIFLQTDVRVAERSSTFQHGNLSRGVCPVAGYSHTLLSAVRVSQAFTYYLCDYEIAAAHALDLGLVQEVRDGTGTVMRHAERLASHLSTQSAVAVLNGRGGNNWQLIAAEAVAHMECQLVNGMRLLHAPADAPPMWQVLPVSRQYTTTAYVCLIKYHNPGCFGQEQNAGNKSCMPISHAMADTNVGAVQVQAAISLDAQTGLARIRTTGVRDEFCVAVASLQRSGLKVRAVAVQLHNCFFQHLFHTTRMSEQMEGANDVLYALGVPVVCCTVDDENTLCPTRVRKCAQHLAWWPVVGKKHMVRLCVTHSTLMCRCLSFCTSRSKKLV